MKKQLGQNILLSLMISFLGMAVNIFQMVADRMAISIGRPAAEAGILISVFALGSLCSVMLSSALADRVGKRRVIVAALCVMTSGFLLISAAGSYIILLIGLFLFGIGFAPSEAMGSAVLSDENQHEAFRWINISQAGFCIGSIIGPLLVVAWLSINPSHQGLYVLLGILSICFPAWILLTGKKRMSPEKGATKKPLNMFRLLLEKRFLYLVVMIFLYLGYESVAPAYIKQFFLRLGEGEAFAALMISLFWGAMILGRLLGAMLSGREMWIIQGYTIVALLGILMLVLVHVSWLRVVGVILYGFGCGPVWPMLVTLAARMFPHRSGSAVGMMMLSSMAGVTLFPTLIGTLPNNPAVTFSLCALLAVFVLLLSARTRVSNKA